jgi:hypothetical protein
MRSPAAALAAVLASLLSSACSWIADPSKLDPHIPGSVAAFCTQAEGALASKAAACLATTVDFQAQDQVFLPCAAWVSEVASVRTTYDRYAAADCLAAVKAAPCDSIFSRNGGVPDSCRQAVFGSVADGNPCVVNESCASGHCEATTTCPGTCAPFLLSLATGCSTDRHLGKQCGAGLFCSAGTCRDIIFAGQSCAGMPGGCEWGTTCDGTTSLCTAVKAAGASCATREECAAGLLCAGSPAACTAPRAVGQACTVGKRDCLTGSTCRSPAMNAGDAGTCTAFGGLGGACDLAAIEPRGCLGGWCDTSGGGTCAAFVPEASPCAADAQCGPGGVCNLLLTPAVCFKTCF